MSEELVRAFQQEIAKKVRRQQTRDALTKALVAVFARVGSFSLTAKEATTTVCSEYAHELRSVLFDEADFERAINHAILGLSVAISKRKGIDSHLRNSQAGWNKGELMAIWQETANMIAKNNVVLPSGDRIDFDQAIGDALKGAQIYPGPGAMPVPFPVGPYVDKLGNFTTVLEIIQSDFLDVSYQLIVLLGGVPLVLNSCQADKPQGWYERGGSSLEEDLFRRTSISFVLDERRGLGEHNKKLYPVPKGQGIYTPHILVFRSGRDGGYSLLERPFEVAVASMTAVVSPQTAVVNGVPKMVNATEINDMRNLIRTQLKMALDHGHEVVVVPPFGCGSHECPPNHVAELYLEVLRREFPGQFKRVVFAATEDQDSFRKHNPDGNMPPFASVVLQNGVWYDERGNIQPKSGFVDVRLTEHIEDMYP